MEKEGGANEIGVGDMECIGEHRPWRKEVIYKMCDLLGMFGGQQGNNMAEQFSRTLHGQYFELSRFIEMVTLFADREKVLGRETQNAVENNVLIRDKITLKLG